MKKINLYVFIQIIKSCTLVFFIFISIAWLLQISRLFSYLNNLQIDFVNVLFLSFFLIPNLINVTLPFIIIFGLIIAFIKFDKDKEIIAMFSLGLSIKEIIKPFFLISIITIFLYLFLNLFFSPYIYDKYKQKEFDLRNSINLDNINISNFIQLDENLILDFSKKEDVFEDVFIRFIGENENIVFAKKARIIKEPKKFIFNLSEGFKLSFINNKIEKLEFENYKLNFPLKNENNYNNYDKNTLTLFNLIKYKDYKSMIERMFDTLILLTVIIFFYFNNIKDNKFSINHIFIYLFFSILIIIFQNIIKNLDFSLQFSFLLNIINFSIIYLFMLINKFKFK
ncbi:MAG: LptF/LptG family permease [Alphaproteobacteria bacterium]|nr:LptF/LptG family permease [Alphaproteobacteria bacterium]